jgi:hypothetical protein
MWCDYDHQYDDDDDYPPEGYVKPGAESLMYVNAYEITRHYGGPEEGGWWYNHRNPIASIPVKAISVAGPDKWDYELKPINPEKVDEFRRYLEDLYMDRREGDIYSVLGGTDISVCLEDHPARQMLRPRYE